MFGILLLFPSDTKSFGAMYMCKGKRVCNDGIRNEWRVCTNYLEALNDLKSSVGLVQARQKPSINSAILFPASANLSLLKSIHGQYQSGILDLKRHEFRGITTNREEFVVKTFSTKSLKA